MKWEWKSGPMGRIFMFAWHSEQEERETGLGAVVAGTTEAQEMIQLRDLVVSELRSRQSEVLSVPDDLSLQQAIDWFNTHTRPGDVALAIHAEVSPNVSVRGTSVYYIANNSQRKQNAELLLLGLLRRVPQLVNRGAKPDIATEMGSLEFCRRLIFPSLMLEVGFLTNTDDRLLIQNRRREMATGIADGLIAWSQTVSPPKPTPHSSPLTLSPCIIHLNGQIYGEQGILVNGNACIPVDLADRLGVDLSTHSEVRRISYRNVVYIRAIDLRDFYISVSWDNASYTVSLRSALLLCPGQIDRISGHGNTTEVQLMMFLKINNEVGLTQLPEIAKFYREEGNVESINYDIAFSQMCLETNFLRFGGNSKPEQNNFGGLGCVSGEAEAASFSNVRMGVRAQIQHLKAYANTEPLVQEVLDPRFKFVTRGIAPLVNHLSGRWSADFHYGDKILAILKRLYEASGLL